MKSDNSSKLSISNRKLCVWKRFPNSFNRQRNACKHMLCMPSLFTGQAKFIDTEGRVDRFKKRFTEGTY